MVQFKANNEGLDRFQLSVPITDTSDEGCLFVKAIQRAKAEYQEHLEDQEHYHQLQQSCRIQNLYWKDKFLCEEIIHNDGSAILIIRSGNGQNPYFL